MYGWMAGPVDHKNTTITKSLNKSTWCPKDYLQ